jgi:lysyl-tRNA synthetase class II
MTTLADYRDERLRKLEEIRARGIDPYPAKSHRNTKISTILNHFDEKDGQEVVVAGRIMAIRSLANLLLSKFATTLVKCKSSWRKPTKSKTGISASKS